MGQPRLHPQGGTVPALPNFGSSALSRTTPFNAEWLNLAW